MAAPLSFDDLVPSFDDLIPQPAAQSSVMAGVSRALETNLPFVDRAVAAAKSALPQGYGGTGQDYASNLATEKAKEAQFAEQNPWTTAVGGLAAYAPAGLTGAGVEGLGLLKGASLANAGVGFGLGGLQGASSSPDLTNTQDTGRRIAEGEATGGALGAFLPVVAHAIGSGVSGLANALRGGPTAADHAALEAAKQAAYQNVKDIGAAYSPASFKSLTDKIASDAAEADIDPDLNPKAASVIKNLQKRSADAVDSGTPVTLPQLDKMRQFVNDNLTGSPEPKQARFGSMIKSNIDDFVNYGFPGDMVPPDATVTPTAPASAPTHPQVPPGPAPTPMLDFLRRAGGVQDEGGDLRSMGFANLKGVASKGASKIIDKENGVPMDEARRMAVEAGYMEPHEDISDLIDKLGQHPTYSVHDQEAVASREARDAYDVGPQEEEPVPAPSSAPIANPQEAAAAIRNARDLAQRQFKANALAQALDKASIRADTTGSGGNIENTTRQRLAAILDKETWSPDELAQLNPMVHGTPITNTARSVSRLSPWGNGLNLLLEGGFAGMGNPAAAPAATAGLAAQAVGAIARRNAQNKLMSTILAGGKAPVKAASGQAPVSRAAIAAALASNSDLQARRNQATQP
jgi:hypothetical protein